MINNFKFKPITPNQYTHLSDTAREQHKECSSPATPTAFVSTHATSSVRSYTIHYAKSSSCIIKFKNVTK